MPPFFGQGVRGDARSAILRPPPQGPTRGRRPFPPAREQTAGGRPLRFTAMPICEITRREEFSASHRLHNERLSAEENRRLFGICNNPNGHGHNYAVEVTVRGQVPAASGMVMNLNDLMEILKRRVVEPMDHRHLNLDVPFLEGLVTTAENVAIAIWDQIQGEIETAGEARLVRVRLYESRDNFVDYCGPVAADGAS